MMRQRSFDLALVGLVASLALLAALIGFTGGLWGILFGLPLVFVLPGYALMAVLVERKTDLLERVAMSLLLSIAAVIFGGFLLNVLPGGLQTRSWALWLWAVTISGSAVAFARRRQDTASNGAASNNARVAMAPEAWRAWIVQRESALAALGRRLSVRDGALIVAAVALIIVSFPLAINWAAQPHGSGFTQLWIQRTQGSQTPAVQVGMINDESSPQHYQLTFAVDQATTHTFSIFLNPGGQWQQVIAVTPAYQEGIATVDAQLYRAGEPTTVYRHVHLDLVISSGPGIPTITLPGPTPTVPAGRQTPTVAQGHPTQTVTAGATTPTVTVPGTTPTDTPPPVTPTDTPPAVTPTDTPISSVTP